MQEVFDGLIQRITVISEFKSAFQRSFFRESLGESFKEASITHRSMSHMINLRRDERKRIAKENELVDLIHSFRDYEISHLRLIHESSYQAMQKMFPTSNLVNYEFDGTIKTTVKLYLKFYESLGLNTKIEELKSVYLSLKSFKFSVISFLLRSIVELTRKYFQDSLREIQAAFESMSKRLPSESPEKKNYWLQTEPQEEEERRFVGSIHGQMLFTQKRPLSYQNRPKSSISMLQTEKTEKYERLLTKTSYLASGKHSTTSLGLQSQEEIDFLKFKDFNPRSTFYSRDADAENLKFKSIPLSIQTNTLLQKNNSCFDVLADLESNIFTTVYQSQSSRVGVKKHSKVGEEICFTVDFEKRREAMHNHFKNILARNAEIEKSIDNFKRNYLQSKKLSYDPDKLPYKGENYVEAITMSSLAQKFAPYVDPDFKRQNPGIFEPQKARAQSAMSKYRSSISTHQWPLIYQSYGYKPRINQPVQKAYFNTRVSDAAAGILKDKEPLLHQGTPILAVKRIDKGHITSRDRSQNQSLQNTTDTNKIRPKTTKVSIKLFQQRCATSERALTEGRQQIDMKSIKLDGYAFDAEKQKIFLGSKESANKGTVVKTKAKAKSKVYRLVNCQRLLSNSENFETLVNFLLQNQSRGEPSTSSLQKEITQQKPNKKHTESVNPIATTRQNADLKYLNGVLKKLTRPQQVQQHIKGSPLKMRKEEEEFLRSSLLLTEESENQTLTQTGRIGRRAPTANSYSNYSKKTSIF